MKENIRQEVERLRSMNSTDAATWLIATHPDGEGLNYVKQRSWDRPEQEQLANHYLARMPYAAGWPYDALLSVMSVSRFLRIATLHFPSAPDNADLALYYLAPALRSAAKSERDSAAVAAFLDAAKGKGR